MKNSIKAGVLAGFLALPVVASTGIALAEGSTSSTNVTLGSIGDSTISVDILWDDMTFDWEYNDAVGVNILKPRTSCKAYAGNSKVAGFAADQGRAYSDSSCTTKFEGYASGAVTIPETLYVKDVSGSIMVIDNARTGRLKVGVEFTPSTAYSWVDSAMFYGYCDYIDYGYCNDPGRGGAGITELEPFDNLYHGTLFFAPTSAQPTTEMEIGDTIGTVTLDISQLSLYNH